MKRLLYAATAAVSLMIAAPALAQGYPPTVPGADALPGQDIRGQLDALRERVKTGFDQGQLGRGETDRLYREIDRIRAVADSDRDASGQLRPHDRMDLQSRIDGVSRSIHWRQAEVPPPPAVPAYVAPVETANVAWTLEQREDWLSARIEHGVDDHHLSGREADRGRQELGAIRAEQAHLVERDGGAITDTDRSYLVHRIDGLNQTLRWEGRNPSPPWTGL